jgi:ectoine hydroxylase
MGFRDNLRRYKFIHWIYNLFHYKALLHNREAYRKYNIEKPLFSSISSRDFPDKKSRAWLDQGLSENLVSGKEAFHRFPSSIQEQLLSWSENGFMIIPNYFSESQVGIINGEIDTLIRRKKLRRTSDNKLMFANRNSSLIRKNINAKRITDILDFILDKKVVPFQTINFLHGSGQRAHSDSIHMTTYPLGYLIAVWVALEDITMNNGPLFYYPGSHRLPYLLNPGFNEGESLFRLGKMEYTNYEDVLEESIQKHGFEKKIFLANKGDLFIWHANLVHGGLPVADPHSTRKSMVVHYYAKDVIKYHEITERPSVLKL